MVCAVSSDQSSRSTNSYHFLRYQTFENLSFAIRGFIKRETDSNSSSKCAKYAACNLSIRRADEARRHLLLHFIVYIKHIRI